MSGFDSGPYRGASYGRRGGGRRGPLRGREYAPRPAVPQRERPRRAECPPELRAPYVEARDFLAGLIRSLGLPARLSFGGVEPARDGQQIIIDIRTVRGPAEGAGRGFLAGRGERSDELAMLIGKHGMTLDALSAITNAVMHRGELKDVFFSVDVEGYRARRVATLRSIAVRSAERVVREGAPVELEPMPPAERRVVHVTLAAHRDVRTESAGEGSNRRVVVLPRGTAPAQRRGPLRPAGRPRPHLDASPDGDEDIDIE